MSVTFEPNNIILNSGYMRFFIYNIAHDVAHDWFDKERMKQSIKTSTGTKEIIGYLTRQTGGAININTELDAQFNQNNEYIYNSSVNYEDIFVSDNGIIIIDNLENVESIKEITEDSIIYIDDNIYYPVDTSYDNDTIKLIHNHDSLNISYNRENNTILIKYQDKKGEIKNIIYDKYDSSYEKHQDTLNNNMNTLFNYIHTNIQNKISDLNYYISILKKNGITGDDSKVFKYKDAKKMIEDNFKREIDLYTLGQAIGKIYINNILQKSKPVESGAGGTDYDINESIVWYINYTDILNKYYKSILDEIEGTTDKDLNSYLDGILNEVAIIIDTSIIPENYNRLSETQIKELNEYVRNLKSMDLNEEKMDKIIKNIEDIIQIINPIFKNNTVNLNYDHCGRFFLDFLIRNEENKQTLNSIVFKLQELKIFLQEDFDKHINIIKFLDGIDEFDNMLYEFDDIFIKDANNIEIVEYQEEKEREETGKQTVPDKFISKDIPKRGIKRGRDEEEDPEELDFFRNEAKKAAYDPIVINFQVGGRISRTDYDEFEKLLIPSKINIGGSEVPILNNTNLLQDIFKNLIQNKRISLENLLKIYMNVSLSNTETITLNITKNAFVVNFKRMSNIKQLPKDKLERFFIENLKKKTEYINGYNKNNDEIIKNIDETVKSLKGYYDITSNIQQYVTLSQQPVNIYSLFKDNINIKDFAGKDKQIIKQLINIEQRVKTIILLYDFLFGLSTIEQYKRETTEILNYLIPKIENKVNYLLDQYIEILETSKVLFQDTERELSRNELIAFRYLLASLILTINNVIKNGKQEDTDITYSSTLERLLLIKQKHILSTLAGGENILLTAVIPSFHDVRLLEFMRKNVYKANYQENTNAIIGKSSGVKDKPDILDYLENIENLKFESKDEIIKKLYYINNAVSIKILKQPPYFCPVSSIIDGQSTCPSSTGSNEFENGNMNVIIRDGELSGEKQTTSLNVTGTIVSPIQGNKKGYDITFNLRVGDFRFEDSLNISDIDKSNLLNARLNIQNSINEFANLLKTDFTQILTSEDDDGDINPVDTINISDIKFKNRCDLFLSIIKTKKDESITNSILKLVWKKMMGDFLQEINTVSKNSGYISYVPNESINEPNGFRLGLANDRPSAIRMVIFTLFSKYGIKPNVLSGFINYQGNYFLAYRKEGAQQLTGGKNVKKRKYTRKRRIRHTKNKRYKREGKNKNKSRNKSKSRSRNKHKTRLRKNKITRKKNKTNIRRRRKKHNIKIRNSYKSFSNL